MAETRFGTFDELLEFTEPALKPLVEKLKAVILDIHPEAVEVVRLGDRAATYGVGPKKMKEGYAYILPYKKHVNLGFYQGALLDDPEGLLQGTGAKMRHIKVKNEDAADTPAIRALIAAALAERKAATGT